MNIRRTDIISVPVSDQKNSKDFYAELLGFDIIRDYRMGPDQRWVELAPPGAGTSITLRELLSHSGGVSVQSYPGFERGAEMLAVDDILAGAPNAYSDPVAWIAPQGAYLYSGRVVAR